MTGASFNVIGNAIARAFGLGMQTQIHDVTKALEAQRRSTLTILEVANRTALLLDIHKKQINHLNTAVIELQNLVGDVTDLLLQATTADSIQLKALIHSINLSTAATIFNKAHNIISDVNLNIAEIRTSFQTALHNKLSMQLVSPIL